MNNSEPSLEELQDKLKLDLELIYQEYYTYYRFMDYETLKDIMFTTHNFFDIFTAFSSRYYKSLPKCPTRHDET